MSTWWGGPYVAIVVEGGLVADVLTEDEVVCQVLDLDDLWDDDIDRVYGALETLRETLEPGPFRKKIRQLVVAKWRKGR